VAALAVAPTAGAGGALDRFEKAHQPPSRDRPSPSSSSSSSSSDSSDDDSVDSNDWSDDEDWGGGGDGDATWAMVVLCFVPAFTLPCVMPSHRVRQQPYGGPSLYIEPEGERSDAMFPIATEVRYEPTALDERRYLELSASGYLTMNEPGVLSHRLDAALWVTTWQLDLAWEHFYERLPEGRVDHLDLLRGHYGFNALAPLVEWAELYVRVGALVMHGNAWTPAFDVGAQARIYPQQPLALYGSAMVSVFAHGPVLADITGQAGVALGSWEIRGGPRVLYQGEAQGFWGPEATVAVRF